MNKQKGLAPVLIVILIALIVGGYLLYQKQTKPVVFQPVAQPSPSPVISSAPTGAGETANWKTYTNKNLSFKYPSEWSVNGVVITSNSPKVRMVVAPKDSTLMNECMERTGEETKNGLIVKRFTRVTTGAMCSTSDSSPREIWVVPSKDVYAPGISYEYSVTEGQQAEEILDQILSTFKFTQ